MTILEASRVSVAYGRHEAVRGVSLEVRAAEIVAVLGANGAGKSSLLKALAGMVPSAGAASVRMNGTELTTLPAHRIVDAGLALVPEGRGLFGALTVHENLWLGALPARARSGEAERLALVVKLFPRLGERLSQTVSTMSGGEQQMVAVGRALMSNPTLLLLDEPSLGLSPKMCKELFASISRVRAMGVSVLLVEQNARQSLAIADRAYLMENGRIVGAGTAQDMRNDAAVSRAYLGGVPPTPIYSTEGETT